jgi:putative ABC transport system ATP-binding protein
LFLSFLKEAFLSQPVIQVEDVTRRYSRGGSTVLALDNFSLEVETGAFRAIMGPSGSGKSTLLHLLGGLDHPNEGLVRVAGEDLSRLSGSSLSRFRADQIGFIFQGFNLLPVLTALQNVELPLLLTRLSRKERREHALHALHLVGLEDRKDHLPGQLSGGQEQRVAIARALVTDPTVILADEPTGDLDRGSADAVLELLVRLNKESSKTVIMVTHDPRAAKAAQDVVHLDKGKIDKVVVNQGAPASPEKSPECPCPGD